MDYLSENLGCHFASAVNLTADLHILDIKNKNGKNAKALDLQHNYSLPIVLIWIGW